MTDNSDTLDFIYRATSAQLFLSITNWRGMPESRPAATRQLGPLRNVCRNIQRDAKFNIDLGADRAMAVLLADEDFAEISELFSMFGGERPPAMRIGGGRVALAFIEEGLPAERIARQVEPGSDMPGWPSWFAQRSERPRGMPAFPAVPKWLAAHLRGQALPELPPPPAKPRARPAGCWNCAAFCQSRDNFGECRARPPAAGFAGGNVDRMSRAWPAVDADDRCGQHKATTGEAPGKCGTCRHWRRDSVASTRGKCLAELPVFAVNNVGTPAGPRAWWPITEQVDGCRRHAESG